MRGGRKSRMTKGKNALPQLIPRKILFGNPTKASPQLAPNGKRLAYIAPVDGVLNVWVGSTETNDFQPVTDDRDRGVRQYLWGRDSKSLLYLQDTGGDENWLLYMVDLGSKEKRELTPFDKVQVHIIDHTKHFPNHILIGLNKEDERLHDAYLLELRSGEMELVAKNPGNVVGWVSDSELKIRGAVAARTDGGFDLLVRETDQSDWCEVLTWSAEENMNSGPVGFSKDGSSMYLRDSRESNAARLIKLELNSGDQEVIAEDLTYDASSVMINPDTYEIEMVGFARARLEWEVVDETIADDVGKIRSLNVGDFVIYDRTDKDDQWLVGFTQDAGPVAYYSYDRKTQIGSLLFYNRPDLAEYELAPMEPISLTSRDGLTLHGYLTVPVGVSRKNLPMVLNVHGGPWVRDTWGYDPETQWFANRGYACLQINYRGSTGYGKEFVNAGDREWGGKMHDDLVDAVHWAIEKGIADSERIAIYGGSYGGYAALVGATFTPDVFCCAVDIVGPSNLITFINTIPPYWSTYLSVLHRRLGDPEVDEKFLKSRSPLFHVERINIPMLIGQGANDPRVKQAESEQIVEAMKKKGIDHEYLLFPDEGHGFVKPANRLKFYAAAEKFLTQHLGGRCEE